MVPGREVGAFEMKKPSAQMTQTVPESPRELLVSTSGCLLVYLQNHSCVWFKGMTENERGCEAGNSRVFTLKRKTKKKEDKG